MVVFPSHSTFCWKHPSPFSNVHYRNTTEIAAQVLALNFLLFALLFELLSQTMSLSCIFIFPPSFNHMDLLIMQTQHP